MKTNTATPARMSTDTQEFLAALLWDADIPDASNRTLRDKTIFDFHPELIEAVERFISGFRDYLAASGFDMDRIDDLERSFGANVYFSLSGHGCGFFDGRDMELADTLQAAVEKYSVSKYRFEELQNDLYALPWSGKIHLARRTAAFRREAIERYFGNTAAPQPQTR